MLDLQGIIKTATSVAVNVQQSSVETLLGRTVTFASSYPAIPAVIKKGLLRLPLEIINSILIKVAASPSDIGHFRLANRISKEYMDKCVINIHQFFELSLLEVSPGPLAIIKWLNLVSHKPQSFFQIEKGKFFESYGNYLQAEVSKAGAYILKKDVEKEELCRTVACCSYQVAAKEGDMQAKSWLTNHKSMTLLEQAQFFEVHGEDYSKYARSYTRIYFENAVKYYTMAAKEGNEEAIKWLENQTQQETCTESKRYYYMREIIYYSLGEIYSKFGKLNEARDAYENSWKILKEALEISHCGVGEAISFLYGRKMGDKSVEFVNKYLTDNLLRSHIENIQHERSKSWLLIVYCCENLPEPYEKEREKVLIDILCNINIEEAWRLGRYRKDKNDPLRKAIGNKLKLTFDNPPKGYCVFTSPHDKKILSIRIFFPSIENVSPIQERFTNLLTTLNCKEEEFKSSDFNKVFLFDENSWPNFQKFLKGELKV